MFCRNCNAQNLPNARECVACGTPLDPIYKSDPGKALGIVSLILGAVALALCSCCYSMIYCFYGVGPLILAVVAAVLGFLSVKKSKAAGYKNVLGKIGLILGIVALAIVLTFYVASLCYTLVMVLTSAMEPTYSSGYYY